VIKLFGLLFLIVLAFGAGYYSAQHPLEDLKKKAEQLSKAVLDGTLGAERTLRVRHALLNGKGHLVQAKVEVIGRNFGNVTKELSEALLDFESASLVQREYGKGGGLDPVIREVKELHRLLTEHQEFERSRFDSILKHVDTLIAGSD
jgi:hypothetical protein